MCSRVVRFLAREDGAVTLDWVVLTAGIGLLGFAVVLPLATGSLSLGGLLGGYIDQVEFPFWGR